VTTDPAGTGPTRDVVVLVGESVYDLSLSSRWLALALLGCGCNQLLGVHEFDKVDARVDLDAPSSGRCDPNKPFSTPTPIESSSINTAHTDIATDLSDDELTLYLTANTQQNSYLHMFQVMRVTPTSPWGARQEIYMPVPDDNTLSFGVSPSGLLAVSVSDRSANQTDLYVQTRANVVAAFGAPTSITTINQAGTGEATPRLTRAGTTLYLDSDRTGSGGGRDLWRSSYVSGGFTAPEPVSELNTAVDETGALLTSDELTLYFVRGGDIFKATRGDAGAAFSIIEPVTELNTSLYEGPGALSPDGCHIYINRLSGIGPFDIFYAERPL